MRLPPPTRGYSADDPWNASRITTSPNAASKLPALGSINNGAQSSIAGTGLPREWWKKQETIFVNVLGHQGFVLNRYLVYEVSSDVRECMRPFRMWLSLVLFQRGPPVPRRYSEFVFLWDVLVKRYPFRLLPALPPKRIGGKLSNIHSNHDLTAVRSRRGFLGTTKVRSRKPVSRCRFDKLIIAMCQTGPRTLHQLRCVSILPSEQPVALLLTICHLGTTQSSRRMVFSLRSSQNRTLRNGVNTLLSPTKRSRRASVLTAWKR